MKVFFSPGGGGGLGPAQSVTPSKPVTGSPIDKSKINILIVDDEEFIRTSMSMLLKRVLGFNNILTASSSDEAKKIIEQNSPIHLIVSDNDMRRSDEGIDFARSRPQNIPFILMSGRLCGDEASLKDLKIIFMQKPYEVNVLRDNIERALSENQ